MDQELFAAVWGDDSTDTGDAESDSVEDTDETAEVGELDGADDTEEVEDEADDDDDDSDPAEGDDDEDDDEGESDDDEDEDSDEGDEDSEDDDEEDDEPTITVKTKVFGKESEVTLTAAEVATYVQKAEAADTLMREAAEQRKSNTALIEFAEGFEQAWQSGPGDLIADLVEQSENTEAVIAAVLRKGLEMGVVPASWGSAVGLDEAGVTKAQAKFQAKKELVEQQRAAERPEPESVDERQVIVTAFSEALEDAGLSEASNEERQAYLSGFAAYLEANSVSPAQIHRAHARYRQTLVEQRKAEQSRTRKVLDRKAAKAGKTAAAKKKATAANPAREAGRGDLKSELTEDEFVDLMLEL